ncbi:RrF2 family transcriptional regulator [Candidatus Solincola sp.]|nr:Rrf2 family transcriptional regulator [Actinomycetota bacterium]MDI7253207.1 Rrf2 family transcriptional regulator [Actinomycetota bacterium]
MNGTLRFSEAFTLGLHAACYLAGREGGKASTREIARYLGVSEAHLAKVMQRLVRAGVLESSRGPRGGFRLSREGSEITLMDIYESLEGPFSPTTCLLGRDSCLGRSCVLAGLLGAVDSQFESYLRETDLGSAGAMLRAQRKNAPSGVGSPPGTRDGVDGGSIPEGEGPARKGTRNRKGKADVADAGPGRQARKHKE